MIHSLSKDEVAKLPAEQQEALGRLLLGEGAERRKLLARARGDRWFTIRAAASVIAAYVLWAWTRDPGAMVIMVAVMAFLHAQAVNSRIDAVVELLDYDKEHDAPSPLTNDT